MKVFRDQQKVLQENAKALLEQAEVVTPADMQERRAKQMVDIYAVKNPRTKQTSRRAVQQLFNTTNPSNTRNSVQLKFIGQ